MSYFASLLFEKSKYLLQDQVNKALSDSSFQAVQRLQSNNKVTIFIYKDAFRDITNQKLFFDEIEYSKSIDMGNLILSIQGFSMELKPPNDMNQFPAIAYDCFPSMAFNDLQNQLYAIDPTQKSIIAFGTLVALEYIFSKELPYRFQPEYLFLNKSKEPSLFYTSLKHKNSQNPYYYWDSLEMFSGAEPDESTNVFSFSMFLYELLEDNNDFFSRTKSEVKCFLENMVFLDTSAKSPIVDVIKLCLTNNHFIRPKFSFLLKKFIKERICFPGTNEAIFDKYKYKLFLSLNRKIPKEFFAEHFLYCCAMKGNEISKVYLLKHLYQNNRFDEFISLATSLIQNKNAQAIKLYMKFFLHHMVEFKRKNISPLNLSNDIFENQPNLNVLYNMYQYVQGITSYGISFIFSFDPKAQVEYVVSNAPVVSHSYNFDKLALRMISDATVNPKLKLLSRHWRICKDQLNEKIRKGSSITFIINDAVEKSLRLLVSSFLIGEPHPAKHMSGSNIYSTHNTKTHTRIDTNTNLSVNQSIKINTNNNKNTGTSFDTNADKNVWAPEKTAAIKSGNELASFYTGAALMDEFNTIDTIRLYKICQNTWPEVASYMMALVYFRSAVYENGISLLVYVITSRNRQFRQIAAETLAEIAIDGIGMTANTKLGLSLLNFAPEMTKRKKFIMAYLTSRKSMPVMDEKEAEDVLMKEKEYGYGVLFGFCCKFLEESFPIKENESEKEYKLRMCEKQSSFYMGCRYFCGYFSNRNPFQAQKLFYTAKQIGKSEVDIYLLKYFTSAFEILKSEDYREKCSKKFIDTLLCFSIEDLNAKSQQHKKKNP